MKNFKPVFRESHEYCKKKLFDKEISFTVDFLLNEILGETKSIEIIKTRISSLYKVSANEIEVIYQGNNEFKVMFTETLTLYEYEIVKGGNDTTDTIKKANSIFSKINIQNILSRSSTFKDEQKLKDLVDKLLKEKGK